MYGFKYFSTFSGIGGIELGIEKAYARNNEHASIGTESEPKDGTKGRVRASDKSRAQLYSGDRATALRHTQHASRQEQRGTIQSCADSKFEIVGKKPSLNDCQKSARRDSGDADSGNSDKRQEFKAVPICVGYSEIDRYASAVYQRHFIEHKNYGDITKIEAEGLPDFELLCGGFPCQSFSIAGKRGGFADTRGTLFFDLARIAEIKRPRLLLFENVKGLLSHDEGITFRTIIATLDELGYDLQWEVLNSKNFGVPQNRERVFIIGNLRGTSRPKVFPFGQTAKGSTRPVSSGEGSLAGTLTAQMFANWGGNHVAERPQSRRVRGVEGPSSTLQAVGGGQGAKTGLYLKDAKIRRLTPVECERLQGFPDNWTKIGIYENPRKEMEMSDSQRYKMCGNAVTVNVIEEIVSRLIHTDLIDPSEGVGI